MVMMAGQSDSFSFSEPAAPDGLEHMYATGMEGNIREWGNGRE